MHLEKSLGFLRLVSPLVLSLAQGKSVWSEQQEDDSL